MHDVAAARHAVRQYDGLVEATRTDERPYRAKYMEMNRNEAQAWLSFAEGKNREALSLLRSIADKQDAFGKGELELPAREMLADTLLEMGGPGEALMEYEKSLKADPNRFNGRYGAGRAAELALQPAMAGSYYAELLKNCEVQVASPGPEIVHARAFLAKRNASS